MDNLNHILTYCKNLNWGYDWIKEYGNLPPEVKTVTPFKHRQITGHAANIWRWANESYMHDENDVTKDDLMHIGRHLLVCVDAMKHRLDWQRSFHENIKDTGILTKFEANKKDKKGGQN